MKDFIISEQFVKEVLRNKDAMLCTIRDKLCSINDEISNTDEYLKAVALSSHPISDMPSGSGKKRDVSDMYEEYKAKRKQWTGEYAELGRELIRQEEIILRVWRCFLALDEPYFSILNRIYVKKELYHTVQTESGVTLEPFEKRRKRGIETILQLYKSNISDEMLSSLGNRPKKQFKSAAPKEIANQLSLEDWLGAPVS